MSDDAEKSMTTERGIARDLSQYTQAAQSRGEGSDWFGPQTPMRPVAPPEVAGRALDFIPGYNLNTRPRNGEAVDFAALRCLADSYDPLRLVIERRKDQICRLQWTIRQKHEGNGRRPKTAQLPASVRSRIEDVQAFFRRPDYEVTFSGFLRSVLEDVLVIDAPAIFCERTAFGSLTGLRVVDGATIKRVIDDWGRTPRPQRWTGRPFMWNGAEINAGNIVASGFRVHGGLAWPPAYQQVLKGLPAVDYTAHDLIYRPLNIRPGRIYGCSAVQQIINTVEIATKRADSQLDWYTEGNMPEGIFGLPESWVPDQIQRFQDYWDNLHVGNLGVRRRMKFIAGSGKYQPLKEPDLKSEMDEWLCRIICFAFSYPPNALVRQLNRASAEQHEEQAEKEGLQSLKQWAAEMFNDIIEREFDSSGEIEFAWVEEEEIDQSKQSEILARYADSGIMTRNEARAQLGLEPDPSPIAGVLAVRTPSGVVPINTTEKNDVQSELQPARRQASS
ncbi:phage portal protein [Bradyrhizobium sp. 31Argb]|uniref:phage portal protein n=1 Tax=Bradyrhizobium sp. 31Argb TaxID=3141247 RepID=UPI0037499715